MAPIIMNLLLVYTYSYKRTPNLQLANIQKPGSPHTSIDTPV